MHTLEKKKTQRAVEKNIKNKSMNDGVGVKQKEKLKEKDQLQKDRAKKKVFFWVFCLFL